jgi:phosphoserine phosphatase
MDRRFPITRIAALVAILCAVSAPISNAGAGDTVLSAWSNTQVRAAIIDFVTRVTDPLGPDFVPPEERIATFDMDGTVITEKPANTQKLIAMAQACVIGTNEPKRNDQPPFKQACDGDYTYFPGLEGTQVLRDLAAGQTQAAYRKYAGKALELLKHPGSKRPLGKMVYAPMLELARYLQRHGFQFHLVSGSTEPLVRTLVNDRFNLDDRHGIGTDWPLEFAVPTNGVPIFRWQTGGRRLPSVYGPGKPLAILRHIGRPPIFAAGNTMGDLEMLQYATKRSGPGKSMGMGMGMGIVIVHDDAAREYAYSHPDIEAAARENGWELVSMKNDFKIVFAD